MHPGLVLISASVGLGGLSPATAQPQPINPAAANPALVAVPVAPVTATGAVVIEKDTLVRLMVMNEVSTRKAKSGDKFVLRVDEAIEVNGITVIPVGAKAWGEVTRAESSGAAGKSGKIEAKLLYLEANGQRIPLVGADKERGAAGTAQVVMGVLGPLGVFGLLAPGNNAKLKAGDIINGSFEADLAFDPVARTISAVPANTRPLALPQKN